MVSMGKAILEYSDRVSVCAEMAGNAVVFDRRLSVPSVNLVFWLCSGMIVSVWFCRKTTVLAFCTLESESSGAGVTLDIVPWLPDATAMLSFWAIGGVLCWSWASAFDAGVSSDIRDCPDTLLAVCVVCLGTCAATVLPGATGVGRLVLSMLAGVARGLREPCKDPEVPLQDLAGIPDSCACRSWEDDRESTSDSSKDVSNVSAKTV